jgi:hypothetical protein
MGVHIFPKNLGSGFAALQTSPLNCGETDPFLPLWILSNRHEIDPFCQLYRRCVCDG